MSDTGSEVQSPTPYILWKWIRTTRMMFSDAPDCRFSVTSSQITEDPSGDLHCLMVNAIIISKHSIDY